MYRMVGTHTERDTDMESLTTHTQIAMNMVQYWKGMRVGECALRSPEGCKLIDEQIAKYEAQADHLRGLRADMILQRLSA